MTAVLVRGEAARSASYSDLAMPTGAVKRRWVRSNVRRFVSTPGTTTDTRCAVPRSPKTSAARPLPVGSKARIWRSPFAIDWKRCIRRFASCRPSRDSLLSRIRSRSASRAWSTASRLAR